MDGLEGRVGDLVATVARVEENQKHATQLNDLRFNALDQGVRALDGTLKDFIRRIESMISGETQTALQKQMMEEYQEERRATAAKFVDIDRRLALQDQRNAKGEGIWVAVGGAKGAAIMLAAIASPIITIIVLLADRVPK